MEIWRLKQCSLRNNLELFQTPKTTFFNMIFKIDWHHHFTVMTTILFNEQICSLKWHQFFNQLIVKTLNTVNYFLYHTRNKKNYTISFKFCWIILKQDYFIICYYSQASLLIWVIILTRLGALRRCNG